MNKTIHLPDNLVREVERRAQKSGATFSGIVRVSLEKYIENERKPKVDDSSD